MGKNCTIIDPLLITPDSISLGNEVFIGWKARIEGVNSYNYKNFKPQIILNDRVSIQQNIHLTCANLIEIGRDTAIAANVSITDIHHPYDDINVPIENQDIIVKSVSIGEQCKVYNNTVILPGSNIGNHCTIGANSIVSGNFGDYCVIIGAPAKIVKRFCFDKQQWLKTDKYGNFI